MVSALNRAVIGALFVSAVTSAAPASPVAAPLTELPGASMIVAQSPHNPKTSRGSVMAVTDAWTRATPGSAKVAVGYARITNTGTEPDRLVGGTIPQAARGEMHETSVSENVVRMRPVEQGLEIAPGATVELKPGGHHLMFLDLKGPLREGERFKGTFLFQNAGALEVEFVVRPIGAQNAGHEHKH